MPSPVRLHRLALAPGCVRVGPCPPSVPCAVTAWIAPLEPVGRTVKTGHDATVPADSAPTIASLTISASRRSRGDFRQYFFLVFSLFVHFSFQFFRKGAQAQEVNVEVDAGTSGRCWNGARSVKE